MGYGWMPQEQVCKVEGDSFIRWLRFRAGSVGFNPALLDVVRSHPSWPQYHAHEAVVRVKSGDAHGGYITQWPGTLCVFDSVP